MGTTGGGMVQELTAKLKRLVFLRAPVYFQKYYFICRASCLDVYKKTLVALNPYSTTSDTQAGGVPDAGESRDRIIHGITLGSIGLIVISCLALVYAWTGNNVPERPRMAQSGENATVTTTGSTNPASQGETGSARGFRTASAREDTATTVSEDTRTASLQPTIEDNKSRGGRSPIALDGAATPPSGGDKVVAINTPAATDTTTPVQGNIGGANDAQGATAAPSEERSLAIKLYDQHAAHYASGEYSKLWNAIDPECVFVDENGKRRTVKDIRPLSQKFFSSIRHVRQRYKIHNVVMSGDKLIVHNESDMRFDLRSEVLFLENWVPHTKNDVSLDTWKKKGNVWKIVESRSLKPELLRSGSGSSAKRVSNEKTIVLAGAGNCARQCAEAAMQCSTVPETPTVKRGCAAEYNSCMAGCKD